MAHQRILRVLVHLAALVTLIGGMVGGAPTIRAAALPEQDQPALVIETAENRSRWDLSVSPALEATPPTSVDVAGPGTVQLNQSAPFTATVAPLTSTRPLTFTWVVDARHPVQQVVGAHASTLSISWTVTGTHYITVTAENAAGSATQARKVWVVPAPLPDLAITDIYQNGNDVTYQIMNTGDLTVTVAHTSMLWVDTVYRGSDLIDNIVLVPGQRLKRTFTHVPACSGLSDALRVIIDADNVIAESNELNNERRETALCDAQAPTITRGPAVFPIAQMEATVHWDTDEAANSVVLYGTRKGAFNFSASSASLVTAHAVTLVGLRPGTTYEYKVRSTDAAGNMVESSPQTFETQSPVVPPPPTPTITLRRDPDHPGAYLVEAIFSDATDVERVEFLLNGTPIGTDYGNRSAPSELIMQGNLAPQATQPPPTNAFRTVFIPFNTGYTRATFLNHSQHILANVYTWDRYVIEVHADVIPPSTSEPINVDLSIQSPPPDETIYITGDHTPSGTTVDLDIRAVQYDWACEYGAFDMVGECSEVMRAVDTVQVYLESSLIAEFQPSGDHDYDYQTTLNLSNRIPGSYYVKVRALDTEGQSYYAETWIAVVQELPSLSLSRDVDRFGNRFRVRLTVENLPQASGAAYLLGVDDFVRSYQVAAGHSDNYRVSADYGWETGVDAHENAITIDFPQASGQTYDLDPGETVVLEYWMVPILYEDDTVFEIGHKDVEVTYREPSGEEHTSAFVRKELSPQFEASEAFASSHFLIVTHPSNLKWVNGFSYQVDQLLMTMADLARLKGGVLGYLESDYSREALDELVSWGGGWAERLDPSLYAVGGGHLLIVGEQEIVPAWSSSTLGVDLSDQPYSDIGGSDGLPDITMGRIIGNTALDLKKPLQASIDVSLHDATFDRSKAWLISGGGEGQDTSADHIDAIQDILYSDVGIAAHVKARAVDYHVIDDVPYALSITDGFALGYVTGAGVVDGVFGDRSDDQIRIINPTTAALLDSFAQTYDEDDQLAVGNVLAYGDDEIVMGDLSSAKIHVFNTAVTVSFSPAPYGFGPTSILALGDVDGDGLDEIVVSAMTAFSGAHVYVYNGDGSEVPGAGFDVSFLPVGLAAGDVTGGAEAEIIAVEEGVVTLGSIRVFSKSGAQLASLPYAYSDLVNDQIAVGNVKLPVGGKEEIVVKLPGWIYVYSVDAANATLSEVHRMDVPGLSMTDLLAVGDVTGDGLDEILVASPDDDLIRWLDIYYCDRYLPVMQAATPGSDILVYRGHGSPEYWGCVDEFPNGFGNARPLAWGATCLSGNYEGSGDEGVAEAFFDQNGAVFVGSTEESLRNKNQAASMYFFEHWGDESIGEAFLNLERHYLANSSPSWLKWAYEYNLYGDPTFGAVLQPGLASAESAQAVAAPSAITLDLPDLVVTTSQGIDTVTIPGGTLWLEEGQAEVPILQTSYEYPAGLRVQEVVMDDRSGLEEHTGWVLPVAGDAIDSRLPVPLAATEEAEDAWVPSPDVPYTWKTVDNPDGSTTLMLAVYPFFYHPLSTESAYYRHYDFTITTTTTAMTITQLAIAQSVYEPGDWVDVDVKVRNDDPALDVVMVADIQAPDGTAVSGLLLRSLHDLEGPVAFASSWDSTGTEPGDYRVVVVLRDAEGLVLDKTEVGFRLGSVQGEVTALTVDPQIFAAGPAFDIDLTFRNIGSVPITGTATVQVYPADSITVTAVMTGVLSNVQPGAVAIFSPTWDATGLPDQDYRIQGLVKYDGGATPLVVVHLPSRHQIYLPLTLRE